MHAVNPASAVKLPLPSFASIVDEDGKKGREREEERGSDTMVRGFLRTLIIKFALNLIQLCKKILCSALIREMLRVSLAAMRIILIYLYIVL